MAKASKTKRSKKGVSKKKYGGSKKKPKSNPEMMMSEDEMMPIHKQTGKGMKGKKGMK